MGWIPRWGSLWMAFPSVSPPDFISVFSPMSILFPLLRRTEAPTLWSSFFLRSVILGILSFWANIPCLSQGFYFCTKHNDREASWGGKGLFSLHFHIAVHHQRKSGHELTQGTFHQELMQRPSRGAAYWLASLGLFSLLSYRTQDYQPRDGITHNGLGLSHLITD